MPLVKVKPHEPFEAALRRFKRIVEKSSLLSRARKKQAYEKPSAERKRKRAAAKKRARKKILRENIMLMNRSHRQL